MQYGSLFPSPSIPQNLLPEHSLRTKDPLLPSSHLQPLEHSLLNEGLLNEYIPKVAEHVNIIIPQLPLHRLAVRSLRHTTFSRPTEGSLRAGASLVVFIVTSLELDRVGT